MSDEKHGKNKRPLSDNETTKLNKRRQNIKESEQKRRERINEKFDQVTSLLHSSETSPRATKESILQEAIQRIKELQSRRVTPQTLSVSFPLQTPLFDKQEIEAGFHVLFKRESLKLQEIRSESQLASSRQSCSRIIELADLCDRDDYRLYAYMTAATFHQIVSYDPDESMRFMDMATPFYKKIKEHQVNTSLSYFGVDLGAWMHICYAISLSSKGQFDRAMNHFEIALSIAKDSSAYTLRRVYNGLRYIKYAAGETLSQDDFNAVKSVNIQTPQSKFVVVSHMLENKCYQSDAERRKMVADLEESITECAQSGGPIAYSFFRSVSLPCFVDTDPDFGLEQARHLLSFMNKGITGMNSKCDLLRNMAILLISKGGSENRYEAKKTLEEAIRLSLKTGFVVSALRSLMDIMQLCDAGTPEYCDYLLELEDLADLIAKNSIKQRSSLVEKAKVVIMKCRENCK